MMNALLSLVFPALAAATSPVTHTELLPQGPELIVMQVHQDLSVTFTTIESAYPEARFLFPAPVATEPGIVEYEWKNVDGVTCRARVDCVTLKYEDCVERAVKLRKIMQKYDPPVPGKGD